MIRKVVSIFGISLWLLLPGQETRAAEQKRSAKEVLELVDTNLLKVNDATYMAKVSVHRGGKTVKSMDFEVIVKGLHRKRIEFLAPGDLAGTSIVTTEDNVTYVYMPAYKKVRRVASHVNNQGFMGTDVSGEELGTASLSSGWTGTILKDTPDKWVLKLTPENSTETSYARMIVTVLKQYGGVSQIDSYNKDGKKVKTQVRTDWQTFSDSGKKTSITMPTTYTYTDHLTGSKTVMRFVGCKLNQSVPDSLFSRRSLLRGR